LRVALRGSNRDESGPAIDQIPAGPSCPATDERGVPRPQGTSCDIGAQGFSTPPGASIIAPANAVHGPQGGDQEAPAARLSSIGQTHKRWSEHRHRGHAQPVGTTFSFTLNAPAAVTLTFTERTIVRKRGHRCVGATARNRHATRCTIITTLGSLHVDADSGTTHIDFTGRIGRRTLRPGSYGVSFSLTREKPARMLSFTVVS
jgi:hypothetical protein